MVTRSRRMITTLGGISILGVAVVYAVFWTLPCATAAPRCKVRPRSGFCQVPGEWAGTWYWLRSPDEEQRVIASLYNRYCIRCHGVDGRGVWDIPDVPDFANARWQASRSDGELARLILEGRGAVMPPFRGTFTLEECWAMARYLRSFVPGTEMSRPDFSEQPSATSKSQSAEVPAQNLGSPMPASFSTSQSGPDDNHFVGPG